MQGAETSATLAIKDAEDKYNHIIISGEFKEIVKHVVIK